MNITKFGAFVNILPGRDGLVHISKMGGGKRIDKVEDVLDLGDELEVQVDDVDPNGKVSPQPRSPPLGGGGAAAAVAPSARRVERPSRGSSRPAAATGETVSFEDAFDAEIREEFGDLGPGQHQRRDGRGGAATAAAVAVRGGSRSAAAAAAAAADAEHRGPIDHHRHAGRRASASSPSGCPRRGRSPSGAGSAIGGRDEAPGLAGASHFLEHLLFKGTATRSAREIAEAVDAVGGEMNAFTAKEHTAFYCRLPAPVGSASASTLLADVARPARRSGPTRSRPSAR